MKKSTKRLKAFTLVELIIVMAIFSMIMFGAIMLVDPIRSLFKSTSNFEDSRAAMDNITKYIESTLRNANRMHIYVGWEKFEDISATIDSSTEWASDKILEGGAIDASTTWGMPVWEVPSGNDAPAKFFLQNFLIGGNKKLKYTWVNPTATWVDGTVEYKMEFAHTVTVNREGVDTSLEPSKFSFDILEIKHRDTNGDGFANELDEGIIDEINLITVGLKADGTPDYANRKTEPAVNPVYFKNYDYKLVWGEVLVNENGNPIPMDPVSADGGATFEQPDDFQYYNLTSQSSGFFDMTRMAVTLVGKPKETKKDPNPTFIDSKLTMISSFGLLNTVKDGKILGEEVCFDVSASTLTIEKLIDITDNSEVTDTTKINAAIAAKQAEDKMPSGGTTPFPEWPTGWTPTGADGWLKYPVIREHLGGSNSPIAPKIPFTFDDCWDTSVNPPKSTFISPMVKRFGIWFKDYDGTTNPHPEKSLDNGEKANVYIIFTLPKALG